MKQKFLNSSLNLIKKNNPDIDDIKMEEFRYGLEGFYLTITKAIIIIPIAIIIGVFREMILLLVFYNILREHAFGLHASKSWICLLFSTIIFIFLPLISKYIIINFYFKIVLGIMGIVLMFLYAPADTIKAPIIKKEKRDKLKFISTVSCIILVVLSLIINNNVVSNLIISSIYIEVILILPITYKLFNLSYNNYKNYVPSYNLD